MTTAAPPASSSALQKIDPNLPVKNPADLRRFLEANAVVLRKVASTIDPSRVVSIICSAASRNPTLAKCTPLSMLRTLQQGAELGLEVAGGLQEFHAVPYYNNDLKCYEAQGIPGYQGLVKLVKQTGDVTRVTCEPVYKGDAFDYQLGDEPYLRHKPDLSMLGEERPDADIVAFYAVAFFKDGSTQFEVMGRAAVEKLKARALEKKRNTASSPWNTDFAEMGRKTALRRLCKRLPKTSALAKALDLQAAAESGEFLTHDLAAGHHAVEGDVIPAGAAAAGGDPSGSASPAGSGAEAAHQSDGNLDFVYGTTLSEKQVGTAKGHADRLGLDHNASRRVISAVSFGEKQPARAWMDLLFSKDDAQIRFAFENHPAFAAPAGPLPGAVGGTPTSGSVEDPLGDTGWPEEV